MIVAVIKKYLSTFNRSICYSAKWISAINITLHKCISIHLFSAHVQWVDIIHSLSTPLILQGSQGPGSLFQLTLGWRAGYTLDRWLVLTQRAALRHVPSSEYRHKQPFPLTVTPRSSWSLPHTSLHVFGTLQAEYPEKHRDGENMQTPHRTALGFEPRSFLLWLYHVSREIM